MIKKESVKRSKDEHKLSRSKLLYFNFWHDKWIQGSPSPFHLLIDSNIPPMIENFHSEETENIHNENNTNGNDKIPDSFSQSSELVCL